MKKSAIFLALLLSLVMVSTALALPWAQPSGSAPNDNADPPINVSETAQTKLGGLTIGYTGSGLLKAAYKFLVGATTPSTRFGADLGYVAEFQGDIGAEKYCKADGTGCVEAGSLGGGFWASGTNPNNIYNTNTGNVGVGTGASGALDSKLTIQGSSPTTADNLLNVGGTANGRLKVRHIEGKDYDSADSDNLYLQQGINKDTIINAGGSTGSVAIGTTADPNGLAKLFVNGRIGFPHVSGDGTYAGLIDYRTSSFDSSALNIFGGGAQGLRKVRIFDKIASPTYCDENGANCYTTAQMAGGSALGDNLGDHIADTNLNMDTNNIINAGAISATSVCVGTTCLVPAGVPAFSTALSESIYVPWGSGLVESIEPLGTVPVYCSLAMVKPAGPGDCGCFVERDGAQWNLWARRTAGTESCQIWCQAACLVVN